MQYISSEAGTRLAKARVRLREAERSDGFVGRVRAEQEFDEAAEALADELIASGYHDLDGGEG